MLAFSISTSLKYFYLLISNSLIEDFKSFKLILHQNCAHDKSAKLSYYLKTSFLIAANGFPLLLHFQTQQSLLDPKSFVQNKPHPYFVNIAIPPLLSGLHNARLAQAQNNRQRVIAILE